jgi:hypothetical protein
VCAIAEKTANYNDIESESCTQRKKNSAVAQNIKPEEGIQQAPVQSVLSLGEAAPI